MANNGNVNDTDKTGDIITWVIILILMFVLPPVGWIWLLFKCGVFSGGKAQDTRKRKKRSRLEKKTGRGLATLLLLASIAMGIAGFVAFGRWISGGLTDVTDLVMGVLWLLGSGVSFFSRNIVSHRFSRYKNYNAFIGEREIIPVSDIVQVSGKSQKLVIRDLQAMINSGYFDSAAYIDNELECLVLSSDAAHKLRMEIKGAQDELLQVIESTDVPADQYAANLTELREVNSLIKDEAISNKVSRLEELTGKIFKIVVENPEKQPQLRRFMSYYLPTTLKLVRSYATLEKQGVKGENIMSTKRSISDILDTLSTGFEQQLDQLFKSDAIDIAADINVLESLMQQDGLKADKSEFKVMSSGTF